MRKLAYEYDQMRITDKNIYTYFKKGCFSDALDA